MKELLIDHTTVLARPSCPYHHAAVSLKPILEEFKTKGYPGEPTVFNPRYRGQEQQRAIDLYALAVPLIEKTVKHAYQQRKEPLFYTQEKQVIYCTKNSTSPYTIIRENISRSLSEKLQTYLYSPAPNTPALVKKNLEAYENLATIHTKDWDASRFIGNGISTATIFMSQLLEVIPAVYSLRKYSSTLSPETLTQSAQQSYPVIATLAKLHLEDFTQITSEIGGKSQKKLSPHSFRIKLNGGIEFTDDTILNLQKLQRREKRRARIGCPALYSSAMRILWNWHVEVGAKIYEKLYA